MILADTGEALCVCVSVHSCVPQCVYVFIQVFVLNVHVENLT